MSRPRLTLQRGLLVSLTAAMTTWVSLLAWKGFVADSANFLGPLMTFAVVMALVGALGRWLRVPLVVIVLVQLVVLGIWLLRQYGDGGFISPDGFDNLGAAFRHAMHSAQTFKAPVPRSVPTVTPLLVLGGGACLILVDVLAVGLARVPLAGLPLLLIYSLPVSIIESGVSWIVFVLMASGFLVLLFLREDERFSQWGRSVRADPRSADPHGFGVRTGSARSNAAGIGATVTALALVLPIFIPEFEFGLWSGGIGNGPGRGVTIVNPITDLRRDLTRGEDIPLLTVTTPDGTPSYLKVAVLTSFNGEAWTTGDRKIPDSQTANGTRMPPMAGLSFNTPTEPYHLDLNAVDGFESHWLPVPDLVTSADAPGVWKYDTSTRDFIGGDNDLTTSGLRWTAEGLRATYDAERLASAGPAPDNIRTTYTDLPPSGIPVIARSLAADLATDQPSDYQKAVAIQNYFRRPGNFHYDLTVDQANGSDALEKFLSDGEEGHRGYCEQFASAFAVIARLMHVPTRVVVGFLNPTNIAEDTYVFSAYDLHAWPEVYINGAGWVAFEPTPGNGATAPAFTKHIVTGTPSVSPTVGSSTGEEPPSHQPTASPSANQAQGATGNASGGFPWLWFAGGFIGLLLLVGLAFVPQVLRRSRRRARWSVGTAEAAWAELRDSVLDLRLPWPEGRSPQATNAHLQPLLAAEDGSIRPALGRQANPEAAAALDRLVSALELERYSGRPLVVDPADLERDVVACVASLTAGVGAGVARQARWLPRSLRRSAATGDGLTRVRSGRDSVVDHVS